MSSWQVKLLGQLERLNHLLVLTTKDDLIQVDHKLYGHVCNLFADDDEPLQMVRDILSEQSEEYNQRKYK